MMHFALCLSKYAVPRHAGRHAGRQTSSKMESVQLSCFLLHDLNLQSKYLLLGCSVVFYSFHNFGQLETHKKLFVCSFCILTEQENSHKIRFLSQSYSGCILNLTKQMRAELGPFFPSFQKKIISNKVILFTQSNFSPFHSRCELVCVCVCLSP